MGWLITLGVLLLIGSIPVGVGLSYEDSRFLMKIRVMGLSFDLPKGKKKEEKPESDQETNAESVKQPNRLKAALQKRKEEKQEKKEAEQREKEFQKKLEAAKSGEELPQKPKRDLTAYLPFVRLAIDFLGSLRQKLRIEKLYLKLILAADDPCDLARLYGCSWAGISNLQGSLNRLFVIQDQDINVECDFLAEKIFVSARVDLTLTIGRALELAVGYGIRALKEFLIFKKRKGGAAI